MFFSSPSSICVFIMRTVCAKGSDKCRGTVKLFGTLLTRQKGIQARRQGTEIRCGVVRCTRSRMTVAITEAKTSNVESALMSGVIPRFTDE